MLCTEGTLRSCNTILPLMFYWQNLVTGQCLVAKEAGKCVYFHTKCIAKNWGVLSLRTTTREKNLVNESV